GKSEIVKSNYDNVFRIIDVGYEIDRDKVYSAGVNLLVEISKVFLDRKDYEKVIIYNKWFVNKFPKGKEVYQNLGYYYNLWGIDLMNAGYLEKSVKVFEEGIKDLPNDNVLKQNCSIAYAKLSQMSFEKGDFENSVLFVNRAIELNSSKQLDELRKNIFIGWARYLAFSEENFNKAKEVCENGFRIYPNEIQLKKIYDYVMKKIKG
ncbi:MAG: tetratricopeptide repeat protein, partial [Brevinematia bacterium]